MSYRAYAGAGRIQNEAEMGEVWNLRGGDALALTLKFTCQGQPLG